MLGPLTAKTNLISEMQLEPENQKQLVRYLKSIDVNFSDLITAEKLTGIISSQIIQKVVVSMPVFPATWLLILIH